MIIVLFLFLLTFALGFVGDIWWPFGALCAIAILFGGIGALFGPKDKESSGKGLLYRLLIGGHSYRYTTKSKKLPIERTYRSAPTACGHDDGTGWKYWSEPGGNWGYEREVFVGYIPPAERVDWQEHAPGVWHKR